MVHTAGCDQRSVGGRPDVRHGSQPGEVHAGHGRGVERLVHHELPRAHR